LGAGGGEDVRSRVAHIAQTHAAHEIVEFLG
jgi:hypothetical protein